MTRRRVKRESDGIPSSDVSRFTNSIRLVARLLAAGAKVDATGVDRATALHVAAQFPSNPEILRLLIDHGANVLAKDRLGRHPLHLAAFRGRCDAIAMLLDAHADIGALDSSLQTPLLLAVGAGQSETVELLIQRGARLDALDQAGKPP